MRSCEQGTLARMRLSIILQGMDMRGNIFRAIQL